MSNDTKTPMAIDDATAIRIDGEVKIAQARATKAGPFSGVGLGKSGKGLVAPSRDSLPPGGTRR